MGVTTGNEKARRGTPGSPKKSATRDCPKRTSGSSQPTGTDRSPTVQERVRDEPDVRALSPWLTADGADAQGEWPGHCPLHEDSNASASFNFEKSVWRCFAGCPDGPIGELIWRLEELGVDPEHRVTAVGDNGGFSADVIDLRTKRRRQNVAPPSAGTVAGWSSALVNNEGGSLDRLTERRGLTGETADRLKLGWDKDSDAYTIPFVEDGRVVNVKHYRLDPEPGQPKMWGVTGHNHARLWPSPPAADEDDVLVCEGEMDTALAIQHGYAAVTGSGGAKNWRDDWNSHFEGKRVFIVYDRDQTGDTAKQMVRRALSGVAREVLFVELPLPWSEKHGQDLTDYWRATKHGLDFASELRVLMDAAQVVETADDEALGEPAVNENGQRLTDLGNAERLVDAYGHRLLYSYERKQWFVWNGKRWRPDTDGAVLRMAKTTVRLIYAEAALADDPEVRGKIIGHARKTESRQRLDAMVKLAESEEECRVDAGAMDADPWLLNFLNGTVDLRTGELRKPDPADLMTKTARVKYDPTARCPRWDRFLREVLPDPEVRAFVKKAIGYTLTGLTKEHVMFLVWGEGRNGKSVFIETLVNILGDYGMTATNELLLQQSSGGGATPELAALQGRRMVTSTETDEGRRLSEALTKKLTGDRRISARYLHQNFVEFDMTGKIFLVTNSKPLISGQSIAIWERILPVHFSVRFDPEEQDRDLPSKLAAEAEGIMRWAVEGCLEWQAEGRLIPPAAVLADREVYQQSMDVIGQFVEERCATDEKHAVPRAELFAEWQDWAKDNGMHAGTAGAFYRKLEERGYEQSRKRIDGKQERVFLGLDLRQYHGPQQG